MAPPGAVVVEDAGGVDPSGPESSSIGSTGTGVEADRALVTV